MGVLGSPGVAAGSQRQKGWLDEIGVGNVRMKLKGIYEELKKLNPWPVEYLSAIEDYVESVLGPRGKQKENRILLELLELTVLKLETFPPDPDFFEEPKPWFQDITIWVTVTRNHRKVSLKAQYRLSEKKCVIVEMKIK